jgi:hypothetical protein
VLRVSTVRVWAVGENATVLHYDGMTWTRVHAPPGATTRMPAVSGDRRAVIVSATGTTSTHYRLDVAVPGTCTQTETACSDRTDYDCDGAIDAQDTDC